MTSLYTEPVNTNSRKFVNNNYWTSSEEGKLKRRDTYDQ